MADFVFGQKPPKAVTDYLERKGIVPSFAWKDVWQEEHQAVFTVAKAMQYDILTDIKTAVEEALKEGKTFRDFARDLTPVLQDKGWWGQQEVVDPVTGEIMEAMLGSPRRLRVIYDTNLRTARAHGQWQRIERTRRTHPYLIYETGPSLEHRTEHLRWRGTLLPSDHPWWDTHTPQNGWGCKCRVRQVSKVEYERIKGRSNTTAPDIKTSTWQDKRTGRTEEVPEGIDPGWGYNPGKMRLENLEQIASEKKAAWKRLHGE
ncbi:phage minor head protein [Kistimonas scapharcae]|uniref:Phage minor head protein n=1 Tax=Kistimonas scapharcae TaxID=1036133 RepID=A0ABP8V423_9GAMM